MKKIALTALVILIVLAGVGYWMWNKPHEDIAGAKAEMSIESNQLLKEFETNEQAANTNAENSYEDEVRKLQLKQLKNSVNGSSGSGFGDFLNGVGQAAKVVGSIASIAAL